MEDDKRPDFDVWVRYSDDDLESARVLLDAGQVLHVYFHWQQAIEKRLKALIVMSGEPDPPKVHGLLALVRRAGMPVDDDQEALLFDLTQLYIETRYPASALAHEEISTPEFAEALRPRVEEVIEWLDQLLRPTE